MSERERLPGRRLNSSFSFEYENHVYRATVGRFEDGRIAEIFLNTGKVGTSLQAIADTAAILASLALQHGVPAETIRHAVTGPIAIVLARSAEGT
jgi:hypothetical protein